MSEDVSYASKTSTTEWMVNEFASRNVRVEQHTPYLRIVAGIQRKAEKGGYPESVTEEFPTVAGNVIFTRFICDGTYSYLEGQATLPSGENHVMAGFAKRRPTDKPNQSVALSVATARLLMGVVRILEQKRRNELKTKAEQGTLV